MGRKFTKYPSNYVKADMYGVRGRNGSISFRPYPTRKGRHLDRSEIRPYIEQYIQDNGYTYDNYPKGKIVQWLKEITGDLGITSYLVKDIIDCDILRS